jgi:hypothetical protein
MRNTKIDTSTFFAPEVGLISNVDPYAPLNLPTTAHKAEVDQRLAAADGAALALPGFVRDVLDRPDRRLAWHLLRAGTLPHNGLMSRGNRGDRRSLYEVKNAAALLEDFVVRERTDSPAAGNRLWPEVKSAWSKLSHDKRVERLLTAWAKTYGLPEPEQTARQVLARIETELLPIIRKRLVATGPRQLPATSGEFPATTPEGSTAPAPP